METFTEKVIAIIKQIPSGRVMTYGQIAKLAGSPRGARQVVRILHSMSKKHQLPWHRVINSKGEIGLKAEEHFNIQKLSLESEGVTFLPDGSIDLKLFLFTPEFEDYEY
ncbi:MGMT family protein [Bacillus sp. FJAT-29790]|uniref:MGMT family protein n=1 Tax=Bacillus sp. FJAT-29790 TaxID=1895002 RepID=UPI001C224D43|nr:MGMT family protein [Bacillus sp. FJAT-29790]MBU8878391.1 MGMT family protein [Bacillus sp. FJAT-29790]